VNQTSDSTAPRSTVQKHVLVNIRCTNPQTPPQIDKISKKNP